MNRRAARNRIWALTTVRPIRPTISGSTFAAAPFSAEARPVATPPAQANAASWNGRPWREERFSGRENEPSDCPASSVPHSTASRASGQSNASRANSQRTGERLSPKQQATSTGRAPTRSTARPHNGEVSMRAAAMAPL